MKKLLFSIITSAMFFTFTSCDNEAEVFDAKNGSLVYFTNGTSAKFAAVDNGQDSELFIEVGATTKTSLDRTFRVEILEDDNPSDEYVYATSSNFSIDQSTLVIPANSYVGKIKLTTNFASAPIEGSVYLKLKLTEIENGIVLEENNIFTYELYRSCPKSIGLNYIGFPTVTGTAVSLPTFTTTFVPDPSQENTWFVSTGWGPEAVSFLTRDESYAGSYLYSGKLVIKCDNTVEYTGLESYLEGGTGTYDPITGIITLVLTQELFDSPFTVTTQFFAM